MKRTLITLGLLTFLGISTGCAVHEERMREHCAGGTWVERHQGPHGAWHEGRWRCPGEREVVEVD